MPSFRWKWAPQSSECLIYMWNQPKKSKKRIFTCGISDFVAKRKILQERFFPWVQETNFYMCSEIFSRKIKHSSCNLSSFKDKSVRQIFWKAILEQNDSVRFSDGWSESKSRTFYFLTSSFSRICLFRFSADKILTKRASSENKIRTMIGEDSFERATREAKQQLKELKW